MRSDSDNTPTEFLTPLGSATSPAEQPLQQEGGKTFPQLPFEEVSSEQEVAELVVSADETSPASDEVRSVSGETRPVPAPLRKEPQLRVKPGAPSAAVRAAAQKRARELGEQQRRVITLKVTKTHWKLVFGAFLSLVVTLVPAFAIAAAAFIFTASNRWVLETNWDTVNQISLEIWASGFLSSLSVGETTFRYTPLLLTVGFFTALVVIIRSSGAKSWLQAGVIPGGFALLSTLLTITFVNYAHRWGTLLGIWALAAVAWLATVGKWPERPSWWQRLHFMRLTGQQLQVLAVTLVSGSTLALLYANYSGWEKVTGIHQLLNASTPDTVVIIFAHLFFLPNALATTAAWYSGAGFYTASDALHTPTQAVVAPIPAIPELGVLPTAAVGNWVLLLPILLGLLAGLALAWLHRSQPLQQILTSYAVTLPAFTLAVTFFMWAATGSYGSGRLNLLGPNWLPAGLYLGLEVAGTAFITLVLLHQSTLEKLKLLPTGGEVIDPQHLEAELADTEDEEMLTDADVEALSDLEPAEAVEETTPAAEEVTFPTEETAEEPAEEAAAEPAEEASAEPAPETDVELKETDDKNPT